MLQIPRRWLPWLVAGLLILPTMLTGTILIKEGRAWWMALIVPAGFCLVVLPLVRGMLWLMGWDRLARQYSATSTFPTHGDPNSPPHAQPAWSAMLASIALGKPWMFLNNCVRYACDEQALTLAIEQPFRLGTPTIRLPWSKLGMPVAVSGHMGLVEIVDEHGAPLVVRLYVPQELLQLNRRVPAKQA